MSLLLLVMLLVFFFFFLFLFVLLQYHVSGTFVVVACFLFVCCCFVGVVVVGGGGVFCFFSFFLVSSKTQKETKNSSHRLTETVIKLPSWECSVVIWLVLQHGNTLTFTSERRARGTNCTSGKWWNPETNTQTTVQFPISRHCSCPERSDVRRYIIGNRTLSAPSGGLLGNLWNFVQLDFNCSHSTLSRLNGHSVPRARPSPGGRHAAL